MNESAETIYITQSDLENAAQLLKRNCRDHVNCSNCYFSRPNCIIPGAKECKLLNTPNRWDIGYGNSKEDKS